MDRRRMGLGVDEAFSRDMFNRTRRDESFFRWHEKKKGTHSKRGRDTECEGQSH